MDLRPVSNAVPVSLEKDKGMSVGVWELGKSCMSISWNLIDCSLSESIHRHPQIDADM